MSNHAKDLDQSINQWLNTIPNEERRRFINSLFDLLNKTNSQTFPEIIANWKTELPIIVSSYKNMDPQTQEFIKKSIKALMNTYKTNISSNSNKSITKNINNLQKVFKEKSQQITHRRK